MPRTSLRSTAPRVTLLTLGFAAQLSGCAPGSTVDTASDATGAPTATETVTASPPSTTATTAVPAIALPLGETLFFDGDDYLAALEIGCVPEITAAPEGAAAEIMGGSTEEGTDGLRLTPDVAGPWALVCGEGDFEIEVRDDALDEDSFLNYNYTPVSPIAAVGEDALLVACPTSNAVQWVDVAGAEAVAGPLIPTGAWPTSVALWEDLALVTQAGRDSLGLLDVASCRAAGVAASTPDVGASAALSTLEAAGER